jgi:alkylation response protein AidB-like acyl-CoA dehydrogenase
LPAIVRGDLAWCQGYSEPGAGSDLASLQTRAEDKGDFYLVNGSKIWTSGAMHADWMFCLVRTNPQVPKHEGISFLLLSMNSPGITIKPILLLNGQSPFCQTFFDDVEVPKIDLVHKVDQGWSVAKRLLQHERSGLASLASADTAGPLQRIKPSMPLGELAKHYANASEITDRVLRDEIIGNEMLKQAYTLTQARAVAESEINTPRAATSIFKYVEAEYVKEQLELQNRIRGTQAFGWEGDMFTEEEISMCRLNLEAKSISIAGGSNEIQLNIIAKRVLGLPD